MKFVNDLLNELKEKFPNTQYIIISQPVKYEGQVLRLHYALYDKPHSRALFSFDASIEVLGDLLGLGLCEVTEHNAKQMVISAQEGKSNIWAEIFKCDNCGYHYECPAEKLYDDDREDNKLFCSMECMFDWESEQE